GIAFKKALENSAITLAFNMDADYFYVGVKALKEEWPQALNLLTQALTSPAFPAKAMELVKIQILQAQQVQTQRVDTLANILWNKLFFGDHPYGHFHLGTVESINSITQADLQHYLQQHFTQSNIVLSIVGDVNIATLPDELAAFLHTLPKQADLPALKPFIPAERGVEQFQTKPFVQSAIAFGMPAVTRHHPDFYALSILNYILGGGGLESRLMKKIREASGLTYSVHTELTSLREAGMIKGLVTSDHATTQAAIEQVNEVIANLHKTGVTQKEVEAAKQYLIRSLPLKLDKNEHLAAMVLQMQLDDLGKDFLERRQNLISAVTLDAVNRAAKKYLNPVQLTLMGVGRFE
ncbi:MAG: M16 family metallopeptidase, partial [Burkholderiales bacterium]